MQNLQQLKLLVWQVHFSIFFGFSCCRGLAAWIKRFLFTLRRWCRSLFSFYFLAKVNFFPVLFPWFVDTAGKVNMYGERVSAGVRPISDRGCGSSGARWDCAPQMLRVWLWAKPGCGSAVHGHAACWSGQTSAGQIITGRWGDQRDRLDSWIFSFISKHNSHILLPDET